MILWAALREMAKVFNKRQSPTTMCGPCRHSDDHETHNPECACACHEAWRKRV